VSLVLPSLYPHRWFRRQLRLPREKEMNVWLPLVVFGVLLLVGFVVIYLVSPAPSH